MDFRRDTVVGLASSVRSGELSARELVEHSLARIEADNGAINAFVVVDGDRAMAAAADIDDRVARGDDPGPLAGIPMGVKDLEDAAGYPTSQGSALFADGPPAQEDSLLVSRLRAAGAIVVGKTNTPELGWKAQTDNLVFGVTRNPWDTTRTSGGSSGGSAAAIASGMVPLATGSDGGGSIRIPSAICGLSGFKPSLGRIPAGGSMPPDWRFLSTRGPMAWRTSDLAYALDAVIGPEPTDLYSLPMPDAAWSGAVADANVPMRVVWSPTLGYATLDSEVRALCERAVRVLEGLGAEIDEVDDVFDEDPGGIWQRLADTYNLRTLLPYRQDGGWEKLDPGLREQVERAPRWSALDLVQAEDACHLLNVRLVRLFHEARLLITPVIATVPPRCGEPGVVNGQPDERWVRYTYPFNLTRSPAGTVCAGFTEAGLPVGLQLVGPQHGDLVVLRAMAALEQALAVEPPDQPR